VVIEKRVGLKNITLDLPVEDVIMWFGFSKKSSSFSKSFSICIIMTPPVNVSNGKLGKIKTLDITRVC
jgi:hypothetical protein